MDKFIFTRDITKREAVNQYGKLGFTLHREAVVIEAINYYEAIEFIKPFNYKKHIKFKICRDPKYDNKQLMDSKPLNTIVDLGIVDLKW